MLLETPAPASLLGLAALMTDHPPSAPSTPPPIPPTAPRALVRLLQCTACSRLFTSPTTLPCGHTVCRPCLPPPAPPPRRHPGPTLIIRCPIPSCALPHKAEDCATDVCLSKTVDSVLAAVDAFRSHLPPHPPAPLLLHERPAEPWILASGAEAPARTYASPSGSAGGRLLAVMDMAAAGALDYAADVAFGETSPDADAPDAPDAALLDAVRGAAARELDCQVCLNLLFDAVTTPCGHTFCRQCLARTLDHAPYCPVCRRGLGLPATLRHRPSNKRLVALLRGIFPELSEARAQAVRAEEEVRGGDELPLFVCTVAFPGLPTFLHIFEPRYRLLVRRALEGDKRFGMVIRRRPEAGGMGEEEGLAGADFGAYGTLLEIVGCQLLPDGRSFLETRGVSRFRVCSFGARDGYAHGHVELVADVPPEEEARLECEDMAAAVAGNDPLAKMSTAELLGVGLSFVGRMRALSAPWLHERILHAFGGPPAEPGPFAFWLASVLPVPEEEKYALLGVRTVRERVKRVIGWVRGIEGERW
ncbi:hypothetical protein EJ06DRAFT_532252 [Trichodelitschia bisporula]|uniref:LON-domain-containing protein n=1 Tax=Trichodelitschia bisporula TaxID=703511 RepID=A0A6G1HRQ2_9PEZI|nr:hypothetical protein EJ06DRAFT_532252 [Trichodelitschia bisporula]